MADSPPSQSTAADRAAETAGQLRLAEQRLAAHVEHTPLAVIEWDHEQRVVAWNAQAERVFGWSAAEVIGKGPLDWRFVPDEDRASVVGLMNEVFAGGRPRSFLVRRNCTKSGGVVWCEWHNSVRYDEAGRMASILSLVMDITDRRETAEVLSLTQAWMRAALAGAKMLAWDLDLGANKWKSTVDIHDFYGVERGPDYSNPEMVLRAVHPDDRDVVRTGRQRAIETGEPMHYEFRGRAPGADGLPRWFSTRGQVIRDAAGRAARIVAVTTDVTERKRAEKEHEALNRQLQDAQHWESLGVLAGGIAHDFNNILTVVLGSAGLARRGLLPGSPAIGYLDQIEQACQRAAEVCRQMLAYAGRAHGSAARTDLPALIRESAPLLDIPTAHAPVRFDLDDQLPVAAVDPAQVRQVLVSLVTNAVEATGGAGEVVVSARAAEVSDVPAAGGFRLAPAPGRYVVLTVADTGPGMAPDVRARMFDPFFTTKFAGRGLGLAAVLGIVRAHKGGIQVSTAPGQGTTVSVYWPEARVVAVPEVPTDRPTPPTVSALVIDDEMFVREVTASALEELGFAPILAADGPSGLELFGRYRETIKVAVIDVMMPGMTGDEVLEALRRIDPALPVVLVSGFTERRLLKVALGPRTEFLQKPFHPDELMAVVRRLTEV